MRWGEAGVPCPARRGRRGRVGLRGNWSLSCSEAGATCGNRSLRFSESDCRLRPIRWSIAVEPDGWIPLFYNACSSLEKGKTNLETVKGGDTGRLRMVSMTFPVRWEKIERSCMVSPPFFASVLK